MSKFDLNIPDETIAAVLKYYQTEATGKEMKVSREMLAHLFFGDPEPTEENGELVFHMTDLADRKARETVSYLQNHGHLIVYDADSHDGGSFLMNNPEDGRHYINQEYSRYRKVHSKVRSMYHAYKQKFGAGEAWKLADGQMEMEFSE